MPSSLVDNINARRAYTLRLRPLTAAQAEEALLGWVYKQPGMPTIEDCQAHMQQLYERFDNMGDVIALLQRFGCTSIKDLWIGMYADFCNYAKECIATGRSPMLARPEPDEL